MPPPSRSLAWTLIATTAALAACSYRGRSETASADKPIASAGDATRPIVFRERPAHGAQREIAGGGGAGRGSATRLPVIDRRSVLAITPVRELLAAGHDETGDLPSDADRDRRAVAVSGCIDDALGFIAARAEAAHSLTALATARDGRAFQRFVAARRDSALARQRLLDGLALAYPRPSPHGGAVFDLAVAMQVTGDPAPACAFLLQRIEQLAGEYRGVHARAAERAWRLRLEAVLDPRDGPPLALHLEHYDLLDQARVQPIDRWSLGLGPESYARLARRLAAVADLIARGTRLPGEGAACNRAIADARLAMPDVARLLAEGWPAERAARVIALAERWRLASAADQPALMSELSAAVGALPLPDDAVSDESALAAFSRLAPADVTGISLDPLPPTAFSTPLGDIVPTAIDLRRAPVRDGDRITVRALLLDGDRLRSTSLTAMEVRTFGWEGRLSLAVAAAYRPQAEGGSARLQPLAALSWLEGYRPRPDSGWAWIDAVRPVAGPHVAVLPSAQHSADLGFGATLGWWQGAVVIGGGWSPTATAGDARGYAFIGADVVRVFGMMGW